MAVYHFSALADGQAISFDPDADTLVFDEASISAALLDVSRDGGATRIEVSSGKAVLLLNTEPRELATSNVSFADGSLLLFGDDSPGTVGDDQLNSLSGTAGRDLLQGFGGADTMVGGADDDVYVVDNAGDVVREKMNGGEDLVISSVSYGMPRWINHLALLGGADINGAGNALDNVIIGNAGDNLLQGGDGYDRLLGRDGDDSLRGGGGHDTLLGGAGHDWLEGGAGADVIDGGVANGRAVYRESDSGVSVDLAVKRGWAGDADGDRLVRIDAVDGSAFHDGLGGNAADNTLDGGGGGDYLHGAGGNDVLLGGAGGDHLQGDLGDDRLVGGGGDDLLLGGAGFDTLVGGDGDDTLYGTQDALDGGRGDDLYIVWNTAEVLADAGGKDSVVAFYMDWTLGAGFENLRLRAEAGTTATGIGNDLDNLLEADHGVGAVILGGRAGDDTLRGTGQADVLIGGAGDDVLQGFSGQDTLRGGDGADIFVFASLDGDLVKDFQTGTDKICLHGWDMNALGTEGNFVPGDARFFAGAAAHDADDRVVFDAATGQLWYDADGSGSAAAQLIATIGGSLAAADIVVGVDAASAGSRIDGGAGSDSLVGTPRDDTMTGFGGDDLYFVDDFRDVIVEKAGAGLDEARSTATLYELPSWVENLTLLDGAQTGFGNARDNLLRADGLAYSVQLDGGVGNDTVIGGSGDDRLYGYYGSDSIVGGDGNDILDSELRTSGIDTLDGGAGNDVFYVSAGDVIIDASGIDTVVAPGSFTLGPGLEYLSFHTGGDDNNLFGVSGTGNELDNAIWAFAVDHATLRGRAGDDTLSGGEEGDTLIGGAGDDWLVGYSGNDVLSGGAGRDSFVLSGTGAHDAARILDFASGTDGLLLTGAYQLGRAGRFGADDGRFYAAAGATAAHDADDRIVYDSSTGRVYYDADGVGGHGAQLVATLQGAPELLATDIWAI